MMFYLNRLVGFVCAPLSVTLLVAAVAAGLGFRHRRTRAARWCAAALFAALFALYFCATPLAVRLVGLPLERPYLALQTPDRLPAADAIVVLGGGVGASPAFAYPELYDAADRVWHAARLYHAHKAPLVVVSGSHDLYTTVPLLLDLGVPREAIVVDNDSRNTYENSRFTERLLAEQLGAEGGRRILLVTSAWHLPRALGNFSRTALTVSPAPTDFTAHYLCGGCRHWWEYLQPSAVTLNATSYFVKEWLGRWARK